MSESANYSESNSNSASLRYDQDGGTAIEFNILSNEVRESCLNGLTESEVLAAQTFMRDMVVQKGDSLPELSLTDDEKYSYDPKPRMLNDDVIRTYADELHSAVNGKNLLGRNDPHLGKIEELLGRLGERDLRALETAYENASGNREHIPLREELQRQLENDDLRVVESRLNRRDGGANDAGNLMVALHEIDDNRATGERQVIDILSRLNSDQRSNLNLDFQRDYGMSVEEALNRYRVSEEGMMAFSFVNSPINERTHQELEDFARFAVQKKNLDYLSLALRGDSPAATQARLNLQNNQEFNQQLTDAFKQEHQGGFSGAFSAFVDLGLGPVDEIVSGIRNGDLTVGKVIGGHPTIDLLGKLASLTDSKEDLELLMAMEIVRDGYTSPATSLNRKDGTFGY